MYLDRPLFQQIGCAGAILGDLRRRRGVQSIPSNVDIADLFNVRQLEVFGLGKSMIVNSDALDSLQVLRSEPHPNGQMRGPDHTTSGPKESLSIYGLFHNFASTPQGKLRLRQMLLRPSIDRHLIEERQHTICTFVHESNAATLDEVVKTLKRLKNMRVTVAQMEKGIERPSMYGSLNKTVWSGLLKFTSSAIALSQAVASLQLNGRRDAVVKKVGTMLKLPPQFMAKGLVPVLS